MTTETEQLVVQHLLSERAILDETIESFGGEAASLEVIQRNECETLLMRIYHETGTVQPEGAAKTEGGDGQ